MNNSEFVNCDKIIIYNNVFIINGDNDYYNVTLVGQLVCVLVIQTAYIAPYVN